MFFKRDFKIICAFLAALLISRVTVARNTLNDTDAASGRIVGGEVITIDKAPYAVQLRDDSGYTLCGGTLVTPQHVVTAAHCLTSFYPDELIVVAGASTRSEFGVQRRIEDWFIHPKFNGYSVYADVAVIKLEQPLTMGRDIQAVDNLCSTPLEEDDVIQVSGWGHLYEGGPDSEEFRTVWLPITSKENCEAPAATAVCAYAHSRDACVNDSGGPGIFEDELCAIVSAGRGCARHNAPGIFTSVYAVRGFIEKYLEV